MSSTSHTTFSYTLATRTLLEPTELLPGSELDISRYPPIFIYDILQFPGSLSSLLSCSSPLDLIHRMTPGTLKLWLVHADVDGQPRLRFTGREEDVVRGMMVFGRGKRNRRVLGGHYGCEAKVVRVSMRFLGGEEGGIEALVWQRRERNGGDEGEGDGEGEGEACVNGSLGDRGGRGQRPRYIDVDWPFDVSPPTQAPVNTVNAKAAATDTAGSETGSQDEHVRPDVDDLWSLTPWTLEGYLQGRFDSVDEDVEW